MSTGLIVFPSHWTIIEFMHCLILACPPFLEFSRSLLPRPRRLMLLVNPFSGRGQAMQWCQTHILPMVREANISYNLIQTGKHVYIQSKDSSFPEMNTIGWLALTLVPPIPTDSFECVPHRASESCKGAHQRDIPPRMGWHHYHLWGWPAAWGLHCHFCVSGKRLLRCCYIF